VKIFLKESADHVVGLAALIADQMQKNGLNKPIDLQNKTAYLSQKQHPKICTCRRIHHIPPLPATPPSPNLEKI
jgi:hypothetical protein